MRSLKLILTSLILFPFIGHAETQSTVDHEIYQIDPVHSGIQFRIRHFFNHVPGGFNQFAGTLYVHPSDMTKNRIVASIQATSIDTANKDRDDHLRSNDFFSAAQFPEITYESTDWKKTGEDTFEVQGNLSILGQSKPVAMNVTFLGSGKGRDNTFLNGWTATGKLNRSEWGITTASPVVGDEVEFTIDIQAHRQ